ASESNGTVTLTGSGSDIWNQADEFRYRYQTWSGKFVFTARVTGLTNTNQWAKAGLMIRDSLTAGSFHSFMCISAEHGTSFQTRNTAGADSVATTGSLSSTVPR